MHIAGGSAGKESTCNAGELGDPWVGNIPWRRERLPTPVFWPGEFHGLYIVHGVTKIRTRLSDFHFHFDIWHLAGWLKKQKMMITPIYLAPGQVKARWEWQEGGDVACSRWEAQRPGGWGGKGPTCEDTNWYGDGTAEGPPVPWFLSRSRSGVRGGDPASMLFGTPWEGCWRRHTHLDLWQSGSWKIQTAALGPWAEQTPEGKWRKCLDKGRTRWPETLHWRAWVTDHQEQVAGTTYSPGNPDFTILSTKIPLLSPMLF